MKKLILILVLTTFALLINVSYAQTQLAELSEEPDFFFEHTDFLPSHNEFVPEHKGLFKDLKLTDQQKEELAKLRSEHQKQAIDLVAGIQKLRIEIKDQLREKTINEDKILSLTKKISDLQAELKESAVKMWLKSYKLLDEKQKEIWKEKAPSFMEKFKERKHMMREKIGGKGRRQFLREFNIELQHDFPPEPEKK